MILGNTCLDFCKKMKFGEWTWCEKDFKYYFELTLEELDKLIAQKIVADGTQGGLIIGNLHLEGGIHLIMPISDERLRYVGEMEGWEYLTSSIKSVRL